jgi:hypothetical protein
MLSSIILYQANSLLGSDASGRGQIQNNMLVTMEQKMAAINDSISVIIRVTYLVIIYNLQSYKIEEWQNERENK